VSGLLRIESWDDVPRRLDEGVLLLEIDGALPGDAPAGLQRLAGLDAPAVCSLSGSGDASLIAAALRCCYAAAGPSLAVDCSSAALVLELGLTWSLERAGAASLLFASQPVTGERLGAAGIVDLGGDAAAAAKRLAADAGLRLLVRSLRAARRSNAAQSADYDRELLALLRA
jgi:hypothetical protein